MQNTENYNLKKPDGSDFAKIQALNENADIIDALIKALHDSKANGTDLNALQTTLTKHLGEIKNDYYSFKDHTNIASGTDLNTLLNFGNYVSNSGAITDTLLNCPVSGMGFVMKVERVTGSTTGYARRTIKGNALSSPTYEQNITNNVLGDWRKIADEYDVEEVNGLINAKYTKPTAGIPKTDLASSVQTTLNKADSAYQKSSSGIPKTDLASGVQSSLDKAEVALPSNKLKFGAVAITPTATNTPTSRVVSLAMSSSPNVTVTPITSSPKSATASVASTSATGFTVWLDRENPIETYINYIAASQ